MNSRRIPVGARMAPRFYLFSGASGRVHTFVHARRAGSWGTDFRGWKLPVDRVEGRCRDVPLLQRPAAKPRDVSKATVKIKSETIHFVNRFRVSNSSRHTIVGSKRLDECSIWQVQLDITVVSYISHTTGVFGQYVRDRFYNFQILCLIYLIPWYHNMV